MRRVNVNLSEEFYDALDDLAKRKGSTMAGVLRDAVSLEKWFQDTRRGGGKILVEQDGIVREIVTR